MPKNNKGLPKGFKTKMVKVKKGDLVEDVHENGHGKTLLECTNLDESFVEFTEIALYFKPKYEWPAQVMVSRNKHPIYKKEKSLARGRAPVKALAGPGPGQGPGPDRAPVKALARGRAPVKALARAGPRQGPGRGPRSRPWPGAGPQSRPWPGPGPAQVYWSLGDWNKACELKRSGLIYSLAI